MGARPLARQIQEHLKKPLSEELLFGELAKGGSVLVSLKDGKLDFKALKSPAGRKKGKGGKKAKSAAKDPSGRTGGRTRRRLTRISHKNCRPGPRAGGRGGMRSLR